MTNIFRSIRKFFLSEKEKKQEVSHAVSQEEEELSEVPDVIKYRFTLPPVEDRKSFVEREEELKEFNKVIDPFFEGKAVSLSLVGERGIGKTSFLMANKSIFDGVETLYIPICRRRDKYQSLKDVFQQCGVKTFERVEFKEYMLNTSSRKVMILDNCQNLFLRMVGGFEALKELLNLITSVRRDVLWILAFNNYTWNYLDYTMKIGSYFEDVLNLKPFKAEEIEAVIIKRVEEQGLRTSFLTEKGSMPEAEKEEESRRRFFSSLANISGGNPYVGISYWLSSIKFSKKRNTLFVFQPKGYELGISKESDVGLLLTFRAFLEHGSLTFEQFVWVMNRDSSWARAALDVFIRDNIVTSETEETEKYTLNPFYIRSISDSLKKRNIIT